MKKWTYSIVNVNNSQGFVTSLLNNKGMEGWELVSVWNGIAYFKRPLYDEDYKNDDNDYEDDDLVMILYQRLMIKIC